jgi:hypothetical protein
VHQNFIAVRDAVAVSVRNERFGTRRILAIVREAVPVSILRAIRERREIAGLIELPLVRELVAVRVDELVDADVRRRARAKLAIDVDALSAIVRNRVNLDVPTSRG